MSVLTKRPKRHLEIVLVKIDLSALTVPVIELESTE